MKKSGSGTDGVEKPPYYDIIVAAVGETVLDIDVLDSPDDDSVKAPHKKKRKLAQIEAHFSAHMEVIKAELGRREEAREQRRAEREKERAAHRAELLALLKGALGQ